MNNKPIWQSLGHALFTAIYIIIVVSVISNGERLFGSQDNKFLIPVAMLLLFVTSATVVGSIVLGRPVLMYLDNRKPEALKFFGYTVGWLLVLTLFAFLALVAVKQ